jgi:hypothetical protein
MGSLKPQQTGGRIKVDCPDERCRWTITTSPDEAAEATAKHMAVDARHTGGSWVDRDGVERVGFDVAEE